MAKKLTVILFLINLFACQVGARMSLDSFNQIKLHSDRSQLLALLGKPYEIESQGKEKERYIYIERMEIGKESVFREYHFDLVHGKLVDKKFESKKAPSFSFTY